jgi:bifunctional DNA-binding transcriptional regulator/antitoxin component of YhaV-PrlF toxin-antitoxin module
MAKKKGFKFYSTVSDRGQIFIPKVLQDYFGIKRRDKVVFVFRDDGSIVFAKKEGEGK